MNVSRLKSLLLLLVLVHAQLRETTLICPGHLAMTKVYVQ